MSHVSRVRTAVIVALVAPLASAVAYSQGVRAHRIGDTPVVHAWAAEYGCPASAGRLAPIVTEPAGSFSRAEACAVAWKARAVWIANAPPVSLVDPADTLRVTRIHVWYDDVPVTHVPDRLPRRASSFTVMFERGWTKATAAVSVDPATGATAFAWGHPPCMSRLPDGCRSGDSLPR